MLININILWRLRQINIYELQACVQNCSIRVQTSRASYFAILERQGAGRSSGGGAGITGLTPSLQGLPYWNNGPLNTKLHQHSAAVLQIATPARQQQLSRVVANHTCRQTCMYYSAKSNQIYRDDNFLIKKNFL